MPWLNKITPAYRVNSILFFTVIGIISMLAYYFLVYVPEKENMLMERNFRSLDQLADNIATKEANTAKSLINNIKQAIEQNNEYYTDTEKIQNMVNPTWGTIWDITYYPDKDWNWYWENHYEFSFYKWFGKNQVQFKLYFTTKSGRHFIAKVFGELDGYMSFVLENKLFEDFFLIHDNQVIYKTFTGEVELSKYASLGDMKSSTESNNGSTQHIIEQSVYTHKLLKAEIGGRKKMLFAAPANLLSSGKKIEDDQNAEDENGLISHYIGVMDYGLFQSEKLKVSSLAVVLIIFIILGISLSVPFLKLKLLSPHERLNRNDILLIGLSLILICSLLTIGLINGYTYVFNDKGHNKYNLSTLHYAVVGKYQSEISTILKTLKSIDNLPLNNKLPNSVNRVKSIPAINDALQKNELGYFDFIYWIDQHGKQRRKWTDGETVSPFLDVGARSYFKRIATNNGWRFGADQKYFIESIISWNSAKPTAVVSIPSQQVIEGDSMSVLAVSLPLSSFSHTILPEGVSFALIDIKGQTHFHSNPNLNLRENFLMEAENNSELTSVLKTRSTRTFSLKYRGESYDVHIAPLQNTEYYFVTMVQSTFLQTVNTQVLILTLWMVFILTAFNFIYFMLQRIAIRSSRHLNYRSLTYHWLSPNPNAANKYVEVSFTLAVLIIACAFLHLHDEPITNAFIFLIASVYAMWLSAEKIRSAMPKYKFDLKYSIIPVLILIVLNSVGVFYDPIEFDVLAYLQLAVILAWVASPYLFRRIKLYDNYQQGYALFILLWLSTISIVPSIRAYTFAYNMEHKLSLKYRQAELAQSIFKKPDAINYSAYFNYGIECNAISQESKPDERFEETSSKLSLLKPAFNSYALRTKLVGAKEHLNKSWYVNESGSELTLKSENPDGSLVYLKSSVPTFDFPIFADSQRSSFFWELFIIFILALYTLILLVIRKVFILKALTHQPLSQEQISNIVRDGKHPFILLIGLPGAGKKAFLTEVLGKQTQLVNASELSESESLEKTLDKIDLDQSICVLDELEYDLSNPTTKKYTLSFLESLFLRNPKQVVVSSSISPAKYRESLNSSDHETIDKWSSVFGRFYKVYFPFDNRETSTFENEFQELVVQECSNGNYLRNLEQVMMTWVDDNTPKTKFGGQDFKYNIILQIQTLAEQYYKSLWRQCTVMEKHVLLDIAEDSLINAQNVKIVNELIARGLIKNQNQVVELMNQSFRNFLISSIDAEEIKALDASISESGSWKKFRVPLMVLLLALGTFMFVTQQGTFNVVISAVTALGGGFGVLQNLLDNLRIKNK